MCLYTYIWWNHPKSSSAAIGHVDAHHYFSFFALTCSCYPKVPALDDFINSSSNSVDAFVNLYSDSSLLTYFGWNVALWKLLWILQIKY